MTRRKLSAEHKREAATKLWCAMLNNGAQAKREFFAALARRELDAKRLAEWQAMRAEREPLEELSAKLDEYRTKRDTKARGAAVLARLQDAARRLRQHMNVEATHCIVGQRAMWDLCAFLGCEFQPETVCGLRVLASSDPYEGIEVPSDFVGVTWSA